MSVTIYGNGQVPVQVVQVVTKTTTSSSVQGFVATAVAATITPKNTSNKVLVQVTGVGRNGAGAGIGYAIYRNGSLLYNPSSDDGSSRYYYSYGGAGVYYPMALSYLDSPASTSGQTYNIYISSYNGSACEFPVTGAVTNSAAVITLTEISGS